MANDSSDWAKERWLRVGLTDAVGPSPANDVTRLMCADLRVLDSVKSAPGKVVPDGAGRYWMTALLSRLKRRRP